MRSKRWAMVGAGAVLAVLAAACGSSTTASSSPDDQGSVATVPTVSPDTAPDGNPSADDGSGDSADADSAADAGTDGVDSAGTEGDGSDAGVDSADSDGGSDAGDGEAGGADDAVGGADDASPTPPDEEVAVPDDLALTLTPLIELDTPVAFAPRPGSELVYVVEKTGRLQAVRLGADEASTGVVATALDIADRVSTGNEQGLLGATFSPAGDLLYVNFTDAEGTTTVAEYAMDGDVADPATERIVLTVAQPFQNHNAGDLVFGPDGFLYLTMGDGGSGGDPEGNGQNTGTLLGSILRIAPRGADDAPYAVPTDNPFVDGGGRPEIYLYGVRNPWRISFDAATGDLWVADVGQKELEEVNVLYAANGAGLGANLGWNVLEGTSLYTGADPPDGAVAPLFEYRHDQGCSVTGGYVYRGAAIPDLGGVYVFGDYCTSELWGLVSSRRQGLVAWIPLGVAVDPNTLVSFGQDLDGELYVLNAAGTVFRIDAAS